jgi:SAM-dependent methyltransferase
MEPVAGAPGDSIRARPLEACPLCGSPGDPVRKGMRDRMGDAPGEWGHRRCRGSRCGLLWLDPMPLPEDLHRAYRCYFTHGERPPRPDGAFRRLALSARAGFLASRWGCRDGEVGALSRLLGVLAGLHPAWRDELDLRAMHLRARPGGRLLEIGCGNGDLLAGARDHGWTVEGVDFDPEAVAVARKRGLPVREGDLASCRFPDGSFDAVVGVHVVEHVPDPRAFLAEARRVLAPGGRLVLVTPNLHGRGAGRFGDAWRELDPPRHLHLFPPETLRRAVEEAGLAVETLATSLRDARGVHAGSRAIARAGRFAMGDPGTAGDRIAGGLFLWGSWFARLLDPLCGEETVLVARRAE